MSPETSPGFFPFFIEFSLSVLTVYHGRNAFATEPVFKFDKLFNSNSIQVIASRALPLDKVTNNVVIVGEIKPTLGEPTLAETKQF